MSDTLVIQSHREPLPYPWLAACLSSVRGWCEANGYAYRFLDDVLFGHLPDDLRQKLAGQPVIASDLARLHALREALGQGFHTVVWLDADFLIFDPVGFVLPDAPCAVGRELWVQHDQRGRLKSYKQVHNAALVFRRDNALLDFYIDTAERLLRQHRGGMPAQFIGPKLLTALHNVCQLPVMESAGMLSPLVIRDLLARGGGALDRYVARSPQAIAGANLCISSCERDELGNAEMTALIELLVGQRGVFAS